MKYSFILLIEPISFLVPGSQAGVKFLGYRAPYQVSGKPQRKNILCLIGLHKWKRSGGLNIYASNVREKYFVCTRCGKTKTVYEPKKE